MREAANHQRVADPFNFLKIVLRTREVGSGRGYRIYQIRKPRNRHLVDVRNLEKLPLNQRIKGILVPRPEELICQKIISMVGRPKTAKGITDIADPRRLLLAFPELKTNQGAVRDSLLTSEATAEAMQGWNEMIALDIQPEDEETGY